MIKRKAPLALLPLLLLIACRKHAPLQFSNWYFNSEGISSANTEIYEDRGGSTLFTAKEKKVNAVNRDDGFYLTTGSGRLPSGDRTRLYNGPPSNDPSLLRLFFYHKGNEYILSQNDSAYVLRSVVDGKRRYELPQTWFINSANDQDSALIKGVFCEP